MILDPDLLRHLRSMALFGVPLPEIEVTVQAQMAWAGTVPLMLANKMGHEFVPAPKSMRFSRVLASGRRELVLLLEHRLRPGAPQLDHLQRLYWAYAGPAGVFSPKQVAAFWAGLCTGYHAVTDKPLPVCQRFPDRYPAEIATASHELTINLGRMVAYLQISQEILNLDGPPAEELLYARTKLQALYEKHPCDRAEFDFVRSMRDKDPMAATTFGIDGYYRFYAQSRSNLDPESGFQELRPDLKASLAQGVLASDQSGMDRAAIVDDFTKKIAIHPVHVGALKFFVDDILDSAVASKNQHPCFDRQAA